MKRTLIILLVLSMFDVVHAQVSGIAPNAFPRQLTVNGLPTPDGTQGLRIVLDGVSSSDCVTGLGSTVVLCLDTGLAWEAVGSGGGGSDDQTAIEVPITDAGGFFTAINVEAALAEIGPTMTDARTPTAHTLINHTASGLSVGEVIRASGVSTFEWSPILDADLPSTIARDSELSDDQTATEVPYTPTTNTDWVDPDPIHTGEGLDDLASRLTVEEAKVDDTGTDDQTAAEVSIMDVGELFTSTDVEGALQELGASGGGIGGSTGATDNVLLRSDGTGGATVQGSLVTVSDAGALTLPLGGGAGTPTLAWSGIGFYEPLTDRLFVCRKSGANCPFEFNVVGAGGVIGGLLPGKPYIDFVQVGGYGWRSDDNTGLTYNSADDQSLKAGGVHAIRVTPTKVTLLGTGHYGTLTTAPVTCTVGDLYSDDSGALCFCSSTNTWSMVFPTTPTSENCT